MKHPTWTPEQLARVGTLPDYGACACGRLVVTWRSLERVPCGSAETHSMRRCIFRRSGEYVRRLERTVRA